MADSYSGNRHAGGCLLFARTCRGTHYRLKGLGQPCAKKSIAFQAIEKKGGEGSSLYSTARGSDKICYRVLFQSFVRFLGCHFSLLWRFDSLHGLGRPFLLDRKTHAGTHGTKTNRGRNSVESLGSLGKIWNIHCSVENECNSQRGLFTFRWGICIAG